MKNSKEITSICKYFYGSGYDKNCYELQSNVLFNFRAIFALIFIIPLTIIALPWILISSILNFFSKDKNFFESLITLKEDIILGVITSFLFLYFILFFIRIFDFFDKNFGVVFSNNLFLGLGSLFLIILIYYIGVKIIQKFKL